MILMPATYPSVKDWSLANAYKPLEAYNKATPPPGTIPSEIAALVAQRASVTLSLISPTST